MSILCTLSNSTSSPSAMWPRSGLTSPALILTSDVLPAPDGPNSAVAPSVSNAAASAKSPSFCSMSTESMLVPVYSCTRTSSEPFGYDQCNERNYDGNNDQFERLLVAARNVH